MSLLKKLAGQTALYGVSSILGRMINFLLVPFFTSAKVLNAAEFGAMTELYADIAFLNIIYLYGMETTFFRFATKKNLTEKDAYNNSLSSILLSSFALSLLIVLFSPSIANVLKYPGKEHYFIFMALILALDALAAIPFAKLRLEEKAGKFATIKILNIVINVFFNLFFLVFCKSVYNGSLLSGLHPLMKEWYNPEWGVEYVLIANLLASFFTLLFLSKSFLRFKFQINWTVVKPMLIYSIPLMFMGLAGMVDEMLSRNVLKYLLPENYYAGITNLEALGIFGACYRLSMFMTIAVQAFRYAADPFFFSQSANKNAPETYSKIMKWFIITGAFIFLGIGANISIVKYFLRSEIYWQGLSIVPILLLANLFSGIYYNLSFWYKLTDKTHFGLIITILGASITIVFNILLIPHWGFIGAALTTFICYFSMSVVSYGLGQKYYPVPYKLGSAFIYILLSIVLTIAALAYPFGEGTILSYAFQFSLLLIYISIVFLTERKNLKTN